MKIGILSVRNHRYHPNRRLIEAARNLGRRAVLLHPGKLYLGADEGGLSLEHVNRRRVDVDVVVPRIGSTIKDYGLLTALQFELLGVPVINRFQSILLARNKFSTLQALAQAGIPIIPTKFVSNPLNFKKAADDLGGCPLVVKGPKSRQGREVFLMTSLEKSLPNLEGFLNNGEGLLVQGFIPPEQRKDIRVFVVGRKIVGAMSVVPKKGDFRANVHLKGKTEEIRPDKEIAALALKSTDVLGLDIAGVDMIKESNGSLRIVEVNYSPGFKGLENCTGKDVAAEVIRFAIAVARAHPKPETGKIL